MAKMTTMMMIVMTSWLLLQAVRQQGALNVTSYFLTLNATSLQPCQREIDVFYSRPRPATPPPSPSFSARAAVRLYRQEMRSSLTEEEATPRAAVPARPVYIAERRATGYRGTVTFPCRFFDDDYFYYYDVSDDDVIVVGYCFRLVSVATNGGTTEHLERCLPLSQSHQVDGAWSDWSAWSECSSSCGRGVTVRHRTCTQPSPSVGARFCQGNAVDTGPCQSTCYSDNGVERLKIMQRSLSERSNIPGTRCAVCGNCTLDAVTAGQIFLSDTGSSCSLSLTPRTWTIDSGRNGHVVQLTVERHLVAAMPETEILQFELKVRDGIDPTDSLLLLWTSRDHNRDVDWSPSTVVSSGNLMSVTWSVTSERSKDTDHRVLPTAAFTAAYKSIEIAKSRRNEAVKRKSTELISTADVLAAHSDVTVAVGVALCVIVVAIATIFIWHSSRHSDCSVVRFAAWKTASVTVAPSSVVIAQTGNSTSAKLNTTPSTGAILLSNNACSRVHDRQQRSSSEPRVVIGRSASRDWTGSRNDVTSPSMALHVSLNPLPIGDLLGPTDYIPYRLKQSYC